MSKRIHHLPQETVALDTHRISSQFWAFTVRAIGPLVGSINFHKEAGCQEDGCPPVEKETPDLFAVVQCVDSSQWHLRPGFSALTPMNWTFLGLVP